MKRVIGPFLPALVVWGVVAFDAGRPAARVQDPQQPPVFRSGASAVMVDVSVRDASRRVLTGLGAADFTVLDNGVAQQVDDVSYGRLPIDVTVGLDISYSVTGPLLDQLRRAVSQLMRDLRKGDRLKLMLFNMRLSRTVGFTTDIAQVERAMQSATASGGTALFDALSVAMISASDPDRRQLIMFFTDGNDATSTTLPATLEQIAQRSRATVSFVVLPSVSTVGPTAPKPAVSAATTNLPPLLGAGNARVVVIDPVVRNLAADTGGTLQIAGSGILGQMFLQVLDNFRTTYVLYYSPRGVEKGGFHTISVTVNRPGATVQARRGYFDR
jgi:VWFA-related protein